MKTMGRSLQEIMKAMGSFDLTSTLDPTDEQLQALMEGIGEIGRQSSANEQAVYDRMLKEAMQ